VKPSPYGSGSAPPHQPTMTYEQTGYGSQQTFQVHPPAGNAGRYGEKPSPSSSQKQPSYPPPPQPEPWAADSSSKPSSSSSGGTTWSYDKQEEAEKTGYQASSDGDDEEAAYRTWDFLLLAKSRLQRLGDSVDWASSDSKDWATTNKGANSNSKDWATTSQNNGEGYYGNDDSNSEKSSGAFFPPFSIV